LRAQRHGNSHPYQTKRQPSKQENHGVFTCGKMACEASEFTEVATA